MSLTEYLIAFSIVLIFVDFFIATDILTLLSYVILSYVFTTFFEAHYLYRIMIGISFWFVLASFHYFIWKKIFMKIIDNHIAKDVLVIGINGLKGKTGHVKIIDGVRMAKINDDLYDFSQHNNLNDGEEFIVKSIYDDKIQI